MSSDEEYYIILHMGRHFVKDLYFRYIVKIGLGFIGLQTNLTVIYDDTSTIAMLDFWVKFKKIDLYVEHEVDNPIIVDEIFLLTTGEGDVEGVEVDEEGDLEKLESVGEEVQADGEGVSATRIEVDEDIGMESGGQIRLGSIVGEDNDSKVAADEYAGDFATSNGVDNVVDEYTGDFETSDRLDNVAATRNGEDLIRFDEDEEHEDGERNNDKLQFSLGMLFKDGKQRQLKFSKNEPKRVVMRCIASPNCSWRIRASYSPIAKCLQIKITIKMVVQRVIIDSLPHFKRYYVCFDALKRGWKVGCRSLIGLDGCFLKGPFKSEFLTVVGRDANNQMFPIAWAMVEVECTDSWTWFLSLLSTDLGLEDGYGYTIIRNQQEVSKYAILSLVLFFLIYYLYLTKIF
ncbi:hypothetical protein GOBAR_AA09150 [Gossypium barbadense]|uniref:MULE transposase domain-containing protein n=1 Tax=Gossypium barbadense TaxID=3634 RepID=A0A2P5Y7C3_GOSBA|nr:hypothetical protein GOBAR_AA09150 [Gossypium barbadense]